MLNTKSLTHTRAQFLDFPDEVGLTIAAKIHRERHGIAVHLDRHMAVVPDYGLKLAETHIKWRAFDGAIWLSDRNNIHCTSPMWGNSIHTVQQQGPRSVS